MNFVYCFDNNYNIQAFTSMISLLDNVDEKIRIFIIHNKKIKKSEFPQKVLSHINLKSICIFQFKESGIEFPNIPKTHVSEATYYRLFIENYLPNDIERFVYLDADVICLFNPLPFIYQEFKKLEKQNLLLSARTEIRKKDIPKKYVNEYEMPWNRLNIDEDYFNAGVLIVNFKKWKKENFTEKFLKKLKKLNKDIIMWDQDVLNSVINGNYLKLNKIHNFKDNDLEAEGSVDTFNFENIIFYHFAGSGKPWKTNAAFRKSSMLYQNNFRKISNQNFHITHVNVINSIADLFVGLKSKTFRNLDKKITYIYEFTISLIIRIIRSGKV